MSCTQALKRAFPLALAIIAVCATWRIAPAAAEEIDPKFANARDFRLKLFEPTVPGFVTLGLSPRRTADPGAFSDLSLDAANLSDEGRSKFGLAFSGQPYWWGHAGTTLGSYQQHTSAFERILARGQLSLAAAYVDFSSGYYQFGLGWQTQLLDRQDHRFDPHSNDCISKAWDELRRPAHQAADDAVLKAIADNPDLSEDQLEAIRDNVLKEMPATGFEAARKSCRSLAAQDALAKASVIVGAGVNARTDDTGFGGTQYDGTAVWATYRQPVTSNGFVALQFFARGKFDGTLGVPKTPKLPAFVDGNEYVGGAGIALERIWWKADVSVSAVEQEFRHAVAKTDDFAEATLHGAIKVRDGLWLQGSVGDSFGREFGDKVSFGFNVSVDWDDLKLW